MTDGSQRRRRVLLFFEAGPDVPYLTAALDELVDSRFEPVLATIAGRGPLHPLAERLGVTTAAFDVERGLAYPRAVLRCLRFVRSAGIDVIHASEPIPAALGGIVGRLAGVPCLYHRHHTMVEQREPAFRLMARLAPRVTTMTMAVSPAAASDARGELPHLKVCVAENGLPDLRRVDPEEVEAERQRLGIAPNERVVLMLGRMRPVKGHRVLLSAWPLLLRRVPDHRVHLLLVGDGAERPSLEQEAARLGPDANVVFVGAQRDIALWLAAADVVAVPSLLESFGLVAIEAMAAGRPVVAADVGGLSTVVVHEQTGLLFPPENAEALASALAAVLADADLASGLASAGRASYEELYTAKAMVQRWIACYERVLPGP